jgi:4-amino-4-deoxy-L-arabinose transferase-like glycosyltransferase
MNMVFDGLLLKVKKTVWRNRFALILILIAAVLRFYKLEEYVTFLSDQGRDAIIIKRIVALEHLTAIGAPSSIGGVFLGPFYYYLVAPFLFLYNFNPTGLAFGVALLSTIGLIFSYFVVKRVVNARAAFYFLILLAYSSISIELARFSWNPNLLPIFAFMTLYFFYLSFTKNSLVAAFTFGALFALSIQLHYLAVFIVLPLIAAAIYFLIKNRSLITFVRNLIASAFAFVIFFSPLIIFDLKHDFINSKNFLKLFAEKNIVAESSSSYRFIDTTQSFINAVFQTQISSLNLIVIMLVTLAGAYFVLKEKNNLFLKINFLNLVLFLFAFSRLNSFRHPHYYGPVYYSFFFIIAFFLNKLDMKKVFRFFVVPVLLIIYIFINVRTYPFLKGDGNQQIRYARQVADFLAEKIGNEPFNVATWPVEFSESHFLYFLELKGLVPADREKVEITNQMFVICGTEPCLVLDSPSWNISMFGKAKIDKKWQYDDLKIYRLVHDQ